MPEDENKKQSSSSSSSLFTLSSIPSIPSLSSIIPIGSTLQTLQNEIRKNIILIRQSQENVQNAIAPLYTPKETFCKVVLEPLYQISSNINKDYPYLSMLARSQPELIIGSAISMVAIPTLMIRRKSLKFMTISTFLTVGGGIGLVNVKWIKDHK